jgi:hypothetical protein
VITGHYSQQHHSVPYPTNQQSYDSQASD